MPDKSTYGPQNVLLAVFSFTLALTGCSGSLSVKKTAENPIGPNLVQISSDPFTVPPGQHATEVEPHVLSNGTTLVAAFQVGRIPPGTTFPGAGATDIGWATSSDGGTTWSHGVLPGLTIGEGSGPYAAVSDPNVAYDAKHGIWMISALPIATVAPAVVVSRSADGGLTWQDPVSIDTGAVNSDKNWIACDSWPTSPYYGNCYVEWDDPSGNPNDVILVSTSADGGLTWGPATSTAGLAHGIGGQPLAQPNGTVLVPVRLDSGEMAAFASSDGGTAWTAPALIAQLQVILDAGGIRSGPLPSAAIDGAGTVWVAWEDCRFRANCSANDLVYSTSSDGVNWSAVTRVPIDDTTSGVDHFIPGIGIDPATSGAAAHVGMHYYYYSQGVCTVSTCQLNVGFISSVNGGSTWNEPVTIAGPMQLGWLPKSQNGLMVGDYIATAFVNGIPHGVFAIAAANSGTTFDEAIFTAQGLTMTAQGRQLSSAADRPLHKLSGKIEKEPPEKGVIPPSRRDARRSAQ